MEENEKDIYALLGSPVSLVCGYKLISNPSAVITWRDPQNKQVSDSDQYLVDVGPSVVQLNITKASKSDNGTWKCTVNVTSPYDSFHQKASNSLTSNIYSKIREIEVRLTIVGEYDLIITAMKSYTSISSTVPPSKPNNLTLTDMKQNSIKLQWSAPIENGYPTYSCYEAIVVDNSGEGAIIQTSENIHNYTTLELNRSYEFTVVALSVAGDVVGRSTLSNSTRLTGFCY